MKKMMIASLLVGSMVSMSSCGGENVQTESTEVTQDSTVAPTPAADSTTSVDTCSK